MLSRKELNRHINDKPLPLSNDIEVFREFLHIQRSHILNEVQTNGTMLYDQYYSIMACTALLIETFNRRRNGEVGKALLDDFYSIKRADPNSEFFKHYHPQRSKQD